MKKNLFRFGIFCISFLLGMHITNCKEQSNIIENSIISQNLNEICFSLNDLIKLPEIENSKENYPKNYNKKEYPVILNTRDGLQRKGILSICPNAKGNVVLCHPATYDKSFMEFFDQHIFKDYNCIRFDFRWHGENKKKQYCTLGKYEIYEVESAVNILNNHPNTQSLPIYGFGISLGAAVLIETESRFNLFDGLILQSSFESLRMQVRRITSLHNLAFTTQEDFWQKQLADLIFTKFIQCILLKK